MKRCLLLGLGLLALIAGGCGGDEEAGGPVENAGQGGAAGIAGESGATGGAAGAAGGLGGIGGGGAGTGAMGGGEAFVPLPGESRIYEHVLNLVDAEAEAQLLSYLVVEGAGDLDEVDRAARLFYEAFTDDYDFLFFITDHETGNPEAASAAYRTVREDPIPGTGLKGHPPRLDYSSGERLQGVIGAQRAPQSYPPFAHEIMHRWANFLDPSLGFGQDGDLELGEHWGLTSVFGQLGGFDASTLRCETPAGAMPPDCTAMANGRTRYVLGPYGPNTNSFQSVPYAELELYLMGLIPLGEVPESFMVMLDGATDIPSILDEDPTTVFAEASGIGEILMSDVVALHGERPLATEAEKHFTAAFIVVSSTPASDEMMAEAEQWAEIFGNHVDHSDWFSFEEYARGLATMETRLGPRRAVNDPFVAPVPPPPETCDVLTQGCSGGMGCYLYEGVPTCFAPGTAQRNEPCEYINDCAPGSLCAGGFDNRCAPYCDPFDETSSLSCATLCPGAQNEIVDETTFEIIGAHCFAGAGPACDPLHPDCLPGSGCYGTEAGSCQLAGTTPQGSVCAGFESDCEPGSICVAAMAGATAYCQPYCDLAAGASGPDACATLCPDNFWMSETFGVCIPPM